MSERIELFFYFTGATFWTIASLALLSVMIIYVWMYLSVGISFWWVHVMAEKRYPGVIKEELTCKRLWSIRLLVSMLLSPETIFWLMGCTVTGHGYRADYTGYWPKVSVI